MLDHIANQTSDTGAETWREPVDNYRRQDRLEAELAVLRQHPTPFCPAAALTAAGSYVARTAAGTPILAVRGADGQVRAFRNACRHRGMQVASGSSCEKSFVCGNGKLTFVYHLFPNVVIATFPDRMAMFVLEPVTVDRSVVVTYTLAGRPSRTDAVSKHRNDEETTLLAAGLDEDFTLARAVQRGLTSGANEYLEFGLHESAIGHFHHHLDASLA